MRYTRSGVPFLALLALAVLSALPTAPAAAQSTLERPPLLSNGWVGLPWAVELSLRSLFDDPAGRDLEADPTFQAALGLPHDALVGVQLSPEPSWAGGAGPTTVEGFARVRGLEQAAGAPVDLTLEGLAATAEGQWAWGVGAVAGRWLGPLRLLALAEVDPLTDPDLVLGAGAVWHPLPGAFPLALTGDVAALPWADDEPDAAWSAGIQLGLSFTTHTLSLFATNAALSTRRGGRVGSDRVRVGIELTAPVPAGRFFGGYVPRETAMDAVAAEREGAETVVVPIREYRYAPARVVVDAGTAVEWVNEDAVMHTATADDAAWNSGAIPPGERWRAVFDEPGIYPYHCGPHPFMRGVVVVR